MTQEERKERKGSRDTKDTKESSGRRLGRREFVTLGAVAGAWLVGAKEALAQLPVQIPRVTPSAADLFIASCLDPTTQVAIAPSLLSLNPVLATRKDEMQVALEAIGVWRLLSSDPIVVAGGTTVTQRSAVLDALVNMGRPVSELPGSSNAWSLATDLYFALTNRITGPIPTI